MKFKTLSRGAITETKINRLLITEIRLVSTITCCPCIQALVWSGLLPGPGNTYICVYVGAAPLQHHPTVAVVLVYVSVQITAASANLTDPISPLPLRPKSSAMKEISRFIGLSAPVHLFLFTSSSNSRCAEIPCPWSRRGPASAGCLNRQRP